MVTPISSILPWVRYFWAQHLAPNNPEILEHTYQVRSDLNEKISIWQGDITNLEVDAIVNAANRSLLGGGGVDGAIHRDAGEELFEECSKLNGCEIGEAKITKGYKLPAKHVIHTVGTMTKDAQELAKAYNSCFTLMLRNSLRSIAFPCISTGVYGYDPEQAAHVAVYQARKFLTENHEKVDRVIFCVFLDSDLKIYEEIMQRYFPVTEPPADYTSKDFEAYVKANPEAKKSYADVLKKPNVREVTDWSQISSKV